MRTTCRPRGPPLAWPHPPARPRGRPCPGPRELHLPDPVATRGRGPARSAPRSGGRWRRRGPGNPRRPADLRRPANPRWTSRGRPMDLDPGPMRREPGSAVAQGRPAAGRQRHRGRPGRLSQPAPVLPHAGPRSGRSGRRGTSSRGSTFPGATARAAPAVFRRSSDGGDRVAPNDRPARPRTRRTGKPVRCRRWPQPDRSSRQWYLRRHDPLTVEGPQPWRDMRARVAGRPCQCFVGRTNGHIARGRSCQRFTGRTIRLDPRPRRLPFIHATKQWPSPGSCGRPLFHHAKQWPSRRATHLRSTSGFADPIPHARLGHDQLTGPARRIGRPELAAQPAHVDVQVVRFPGIGGAPHGPQEPAASQEPTGAGSASP